MNATHDEMRVTRRPAPGTLTYCVEEAASIVGGAVAGLLAEMDTESDNDRLDDLTAMRAELARAEALLDTAHALSLKDRSTNG